MARRTAATLEGPPPYARSSEGRGGIALTLTSESEDSDEEEANTLAERAERAGERDQPQPSYPHERDLTPPDERLQRHSGREDP